MRIKKIFVLSFAFTTLLFSNAKLYAQETRYIPLGHTKYKDTLLVAHPDTAFEKDLFDVIKSMFDKNYVQGKADSVSSKPVISIVPAIGYTLQTNLAGTLSGNVVFRMAPNTRISTITVNP